MQINFNKKILVLILAGFIVFTPFFAEIQISSNFDHNHYHHLHHNCEHSHENDHSDDCPICLNIELANNFLNNFKFVNFILVTTEFAECYMNPAQNKKTKDFIELSPINLKVRLNA